MSCPWGMVFRRCGFDIAHFWKRGEACKCPSSSSKNLQSLLVCAHSPLTWITFICLIQARKLALAREILQTKVLERRAGRKRNGSNEGVVFCLYRIYRQNLFLNASLFFYMRNFPQMCNKTTIPTKLNEATKTVVGPTCRPGESSA